MDLRTFSPTQLRAAADLQERIASLQAELAQILGGQPSAPAPAPAAAPAAVAAPVSVGGKRRRKLSPEGLAAIRAGVAKRQAKRAGRAPAAAAAAAPAPAGKPVRRMSAAGRRALAASAKARWAAARAAGKSRL